MREFKAMPFATKSIEGRTVIGIAAVHGNIDDGGDRSWPGSFGDFTVDGRNRMVFLWQHNAYEPPTAAINYAREISRQELPDEVKSYAPESTGGVEVSRTYLDTPRGNEILAGITAGAIREMSYAYEATAYDFEEVGGRTIRNLRKMQIYDLSDVAWGMNSATLGSKLYPWMAPAEGDTKDRPLAEYRNAVKAAERAYEEFVERRAKAGRVFSQANYSALEALAADLEGSAVRLRELLAASEPKSISARRAVLEAQRTLARINGALA